MMAGLGMILGGALAGAGKGLNEDFEKRHEMAMAALKQQYRIDDLNTQADLNDRNASRDDERGDANDARKTLRETDKTIAVNKATVGFKSEADRENDERQFGFNKRLEALKSALHVNETLADEKIKNLINSPNLSDVKQLDDGTFIVFDKRGRGTVTPFKGALPKVYGGIDALDLGTDAPKQAAAPAATPIPPGNAGGAGPQEFKFQQDAEAFANDPRNKGKTFILNGRRGIVE